MTTESKIVFPGESWSAVSPEEAGIDSSALVEALAILRDGCLSDGVEEVVLVRGGRVFWQGARVDRRHSTWSCSKSFASCLLGLLIAEGKCNLDTPAWRFAPDLRDRYSTVTLRHFSMMTSGYDAVGGRYRDDPLDGSETPFDPAEPMFAPGTAYRYWDDAMRMFGRVLTRIAGESLSDLFARRIATPIGMADWEWKVEGTVDGLPVNDVAAGFQTTAREMARFGLLYLSRGSWNGRQLVPATWVDQATRPHVPADLAWTPISARQARIDGRGVYGLNWWCNGVRASGQRSWPSAPAGAYAAQGLNNNRCFVIPEWGLVVVRLGTDGNISDEVWDGFFARLGASLLA